MLLQAEQERREGRAKHRIDSLEDLTHASFPAIALESYYDIS